MRSPLDRAMAVVRRVQMERRLGSLRAEEAAERARLEREGMASAARHSTDGIAVERDQRGRPDPVAMELMLRDGVDLSPEDRSWVLSSYVPRRTMALTDEMGNRLTAAMPRGQGTALSGRSFTSTHYTNPRQGLDDYLIEAVSTGTFWQSVMNFLMYIVMGRGIRPQLRMRDPDRKNPEKDSKRINELRWITDIIEERDRRVGPMPGDRVGKQSFLDMVQGLVRCALTYNRGILRITERGTLDYGGMKIHNVPTGLQFIHARDLGMIETTTSGNLRWVWWNLTGETIPWPDMVYLWDSLHGEQRANTKWYGNTPVDAVLNDLRMAYQILAVHAPAAARALYGGTVIIPVDLSAMPDSKRDTELRRIRASIVEGGYSIIARNPNDVEVKPVQNDVKPEALIALLRHAYMSVCSALGVPISIVFDESASNRATLTGKLGTMMRSTVNPIRNWIDRELGPQWYGEILEQVVTEAGHPELLHEVEVHVKFDDLNLQDEEKLMEMVKAIAGLVPLYDSAILRMAGKEEYIDDIDPDKRKMFEEQGMMFGAPGDGDGGDDGGKGGEDGGSESGWGK